MRSEELTDERLADLAVRHGTPLYVYSAPTIRDRVAQLSGFDVVRYAQKANSNPTVLEIVRKAGALVDAASSGEVRRALDSGYDPEDVVLTTDLFDREMLELIAEIPVALNVGSPFQLEQLAEVRQNARVTLRVNPGFGDGHGQKVKTGGVQSKHGIWHEQLGEVVSEARARGLAVTGLHMHIGSGADLTSLVRSCDAMQVAARIVGDGLETISAGGGIPVPYREGDEPFDTERYAASWREARDAIDPALTLEVEPGRFLVAESGVLVTEVRGVKHVGSTRFVMVDAGFHNLPRPAMYGSYHRITAVGKGGEQEDLCVVAGPLCESADVFTQDGEGRPVPRPLPHVAVGDFLCIHDAGAYGASMASRYNLQRSAREVIVDGSAVHACG